MRENLEYGYITFGDIGTDTYFKNNLFKIIIVNN